MSRISLRFQNEICIHADIHQLLSAPTPRAAVPNQGGVRVHSGGEGVDIL